MPFAACKRRRCCRVSRADRSSTEPDIAANAEQDRKDLLGLAEASNGTQVLVKAALHDLRKIGRDGYRY